jgi:uncharacterized protein (TIGR02118 family)
MTPRIEGISQELTLRRRDIFAGTFLLVPGPLKDDKMYKMLAYWSAPRPENIDAFEKYYIETHIPLALAVPHLVRLTSTRTSDALGSATPYHYRVAEMAFPSRDSFEASAKSTAFAAMLKCSADMRTRFDVTLTAEAGDELGFHPR